MHPLGYYLGIPKQTEVLILILIGICCTIFDLSLLDLNVNLHKVWEAALDPTKFSENSQFYLKYLLSGIILVRTFSVHLYLAFYIVMLWPAIFEERPALLLPWLTVGAIKCLGMGIMSLCTGMYTCYVYGIYRPACLDFVLAQIVDHTPSFYMWFCVLSYFHELKICTSIVLSEPSSIEFESDLTMRRRKVRYMADNVVVHHCPIDEDRHLICVSTIENFVQQFTTDFNRRNTRSLDSLLGIMAAEAEKEEIMNTHDDTPLLEAGLSVQQRTAKLLKLTDEDICQARRNKRSRVDLVLFTKSMLEIKNLDNLKPPLKANDVTSSTGTYHLRSTQSEKVESFSTHRQKTPIADFMTEISEIEIGSPVNYSAVSVMYKEKDESKPKIVQETASNVDEKQNTQKPTIRECKKKDKKSKVWSPVKNFATNKTIARKSDTEKEETKEKQKYYFLKPVGTLSGIQDVPEKLINETPTKKTVQKERDPGMKSRKMLNHKVVDFACQTSTLSKAVLKDFPISDVTKCTPSKFNSALRKSTRTHSTKLSSKTDSKTKPKMEGPKEGKLDVPKITSFKRDGYTMAYIEKMKKKSTEKSTKRISNKELRQRNVKATEF